MFKELSPGSSAIDWCEDNYSVFPFIAEFYNTISNALFFVFPPLMWVLFKEYARRVNPSINLIWLLLMVVGASSVYYHSTLSLFGQLLDEVAILWVVLCGAGLWFPRRYYPRILNGNRKLFRIIVTIVTLGGTMIAFINPWLNSFLMMLFVIPGIITMYLELKRVHCPRVVRLCRTNMVLWVIAVTCWVMDRTFCDFWLFVSFPYLHCFWHILVLVASYSSVVLFAYFDAMNEFPEMGPVLRYWPKDRYTNFGIPYVTLKCVVAKPKD
ncbi:alkaline ceramidase 2-like [Patiria miniata]|uniref:Alkaline ceramidase n=1 Tax=Patiria miniata TaxID=46514 RepID=A0A914B9C9_PATMI|nr:alkaline ceramidase 2-like [Patiria miniata]XP_038072721.1 alkaline ceramidase 2-like [Patiria miniata]